MNTTSLQKQKDHAFKKDVYLLGVDKDGIKYWLEAPSWECDWYWGFGYIETYQGNALPSKARDIDSHHHADNFMSEYFIEWNGSSPILVETTFTKEEGWELSELFKQFYLFRSMAEIYHRGNTNTSQSVVSWKNTDKEKEVNEIVIPKITARILEILTPTL